MRKCVDLTNLKPDAGFNDLRELCVTAKENADVVRAVCINPDPRRIKFCKDILDGSGIKICVVNSFPLGQGGLEARNAEALLAFSAGANEVDTVMNTGFLKEGLYKDILADLVVVASVLPTKAIIETGHSWYTEALVKKAAELAAESGAFCVKTSTGFVANIPVKDKVKHVQWMHEAAPGLMVKVAGGVTTREEAELFLDVVPPEQLIFGASALFWKK
jgi:deoxyribose-phosphate aldolase